MAAKNTRNTAAKKQEVKENGSAAIYGVVTLAMYGKRSFANGKSDKEDRYRISLKIDTKNLVKLREASAEFFEGVDETYIPKWFTEEYSDSDDIFVNFSSAFDIPIGEYNKDSFVDKGTMADYVADNGNINGSKVALMLTLKPGAIYPKAIIVKELHAQSLSDMFEQNKEEFEQMFDGEDLPFK